MPLNTIHINDELKIQLKHPIIDLNKISELDLKKITFAKLGAATGLTYGKLFSKKREIIKIRYKGNKNLRFEL
jgi:hypothetical protein